MVRIFVRGISNSITCSDVNSLFSKLYCVEEVYIPSSTITGLDRNFAIVRLKIEDKDEIKKCIQNLNGSLWKGNKLRLELANEWYKDRFENERIDSLLDINDNKEEILNEEIKLPTISTSSIHLKHNSKEYHISMKPTILSRKDKIHNVINKSDIMISCGNKRIFNDIDEQNEYTSSEEISDKDEDILSEPTKVTEQMNIDKEIIKKSIKDIAITKTLLPPIGGGIRKGFGNLLLLTKEQQVVTTTIDSQRIPIKNNDSIEVNCCIEEYDDDDDKDDNQVIANTLKNNRKLHIEEMDSSDDDEPCIKSEDITDEALQKERERAMNVLNNLLQDDSNKISHVKAINDNKNKNDIIISAATTSTNNNNDDDDDKCKDNNKDVDILLTKDSYVNMNQLKNIFYREGGVWFGDDGTLKGTVMKGDITLDPMFLEAEKHGIDIRKYSKLNNSQNSQNELNNNKLDDINNKINDDNIPMMFSFFNNSSNEDEELLQSNNPFLSTTTTNINNYHNENENNMIKTSKATKDTMIVQDINPKDNHNIEILVDITCKDLISVGKKFTRTKSIEEISQQWKNDRDRHILDYKRKTRDMKRRTTAWNNTKIGILSNSKESSTTAVTATTNSNNSHSKAIPNYTRNRKRISNKRNKNQK